MAMLSPTASGLHLRDGGRWCASAATNRRSARRPVAFHRPVRVSNEEAIAGHEQDDARTRGVFRGGVVHGLVACLVFCIGGGETPAVAAVRQGAPGLGRNRGDALGTAGELQRLLFSLLLAVTAEAI